ncbi:bifunctional AP-4-A phosphorylase/ADP sulfurylase [Puttea exsequens]|nr:bifunctional AP-4-A phosphorylase/ADP sulfurylase [Puttea exsequens]
MIDLGLPEPLPTLIEKKYVEAEAEKTLVLAATQLAILKVAGLPFQLRYCPALSNKPIDDNKHHSKPKDPNKLDPFKDPRDLLVAQVPLHRPSHSIVLNKYPVIPQHFILATKEYKEQTDLLEQDDLATAYSCLKAWDSSGLFAFFNSGPHSGASQGHRHIQFLPIQQMEPGSGWRPLIEILNEGQNDTQDFPLCHFLASIETMAQPSDLMRKYLSLYNHASIAMSEYHSEGGRDREQSLSQDNISYNLVMTSKAMALCPRRSEVGSLPGRRGPVLTLNGTILAGTLMVRQEEDWDRLRYNADDLAIILESVGLPAHSRPERDG